MQELQQLKSHTAVAGAGLAGGAGTALSVNVDDSSIEIATDTLRVKASGGISAAMIANDGAVTTCWSMALQVRRYCFSFSYKFKLR